MSWQLILEGLKWIGLHIIVPVILFIAWGMITRKPNFVTKFFNYLRPTWEGNDGKLSYRRSSQFVFLMLIVFVVIKGHVLSRYGFWTLVVLGLIFLLLAAIITGQQVIEGIRGLGAIKNSIMEQGAQIMSTETETKTTTDTEINIPGKEEAEMKKEGFE